LGVVRDRSFRDEMLPAGAQELLYWVTAHRQASGHAGAVSSSTMIRVRLGTPVVVPAPMASTVAVQAARRAA
jgi:hypothetical protein